MARPCGNRTARRVDVEADVPAGILGGEQQQLGADQVGRAVVDLGAEEDNALAEQPLVHVGAGVGSGDAGLGNG